MKKTKFNIGDKVTTKLIKLSREDFVKVKGTITKIETGFGRKIYTITEGVVEDFKTRIIE